VERKRGGWNPELVCKFTRRNAFRASLDQFPVDIETAVLRQRRERLNSGFTIHSSIVLEAWMYVKRPRIVGLPRSCRLPPCARWSLCALRRPLTARSVRIADHACHAARAAVLGQVLKNLAHSGAVDAVIDKSPLPSRHDKTGMSQFLDVERKRRRWHAKLARDVAGRKASSFRLHQQSIERKTRLLRKRGQGVDGIGCPHGRLASRASRQHAATVRACGPRTLWIIRNAP